MREARLSHNRSIQLTWNSYSLRGICVRIRGVADKLFIEVFYNSEHNRSAGGCEGVVCYRLAKCQNAVGMYTRDSGQC